MGEKFLFWMSMNYFAGSPASAGDSHDCATSHKAAIIEQLYFAEHFSTSYTNSSSS
jgi:hypothetical protein